MSNAKSTKTLSYALKGTLDLESNRIVETLDEETVIVHDLTEIFSQLDGKDISLNVSMKEKLEGE